MWATPQSDCRASSYPTLTIYGSGFTNQTSMLVSFAGILRYSVNAWQVDVDAQTISLSSLFNGLPNGVILGVTVSSCTAPH